MTRFGVTIISVLILAAPLFSQSVYPTGIQFTRYSPEVLDLSGYPENPVETGKYNLYMPQDTKIRSPFKAALFSLVLPGAGQFYAGNFWKAGAFLAADAALFAGNKRYMNVGDKITEEFRKTADDNWSKENYITWLNSQTQELQNLFSHTLPSTKTQQYYEMIGKYAQFIAGWPDWEGDWDINKYSAMRLDYMARQNDSNIEYKRGELLSQFMILNRIVSAAEAAISLRNQNSKYQPGFRWRPAPGSNEIIPEASLTIVW